MIGASVPLSRRRVRPSLLLWLLLLCAVVWRISTMLLPLTAILVSAALKRLVVGWPFGATAMA